MFTGRRPVPGPGEEAWTSDDVEEALAWQALQAEACPGCGQPRDESFRAENAESYDARVLVCHACATRERRVASWREAGGEIEGLHVDVVRRRPTT